MYDLGLGLQNSVLQVVGGAAAATNYELREDGSKELREDGSHELRE